MLQAVRRLSTSATMKQTVQCAELRFPVPWGEVAARAWGPQEGRPVLCLHGWADNAGSFNRLAPLLPAEWRVVCVDFPGHGRSSHRPPGEFYSFTTYLADLCWVTRALQWKRFSIIGHSMGGNVGGLFSAVFPELVDSLVILDSLGFLPTAQEEMAGIVRKGVEELVQFEAERERGRREKVYSYDSALKRLQAANPSLSEESVAVLLERGSTAVEGGVVFNRDYRINLTNIVRITLEQSLDMQARIQARVLLVMAEEGILRLYRQRPQQAEMLQQLIKGYGDKLSEVSVVEVPGDHHVHLNSPETVAPLITAFLNSGTPVTPPSAKL